MVPCKSILLFLAAVSASLHATLGFAPHALPPSHVGRCTSHSTLEPLFMMNKKKKNRPLPNTKSKGFASSPSSPDSFSTTSTIIQANTSPNFRYAGSIRPGRQSPKRDVPSEKIMFPDYALDGRPKNKSPLFPWVIEVKKADEIEKMRAAGRVAREVLDLAGREVRPGITT